MEAKAIMVLDQTAPLDLGPYCLQYKLRKYIADKNCCEWPKRTACLVVNPIMVGNFSFLFNCTPVGRTSDSMAVLTYRLIY